MMRPDMMQRNTGFTLLELLVSLSIFALIGVMAYGGLQSVMIQQSRTGEASQRLADLQKAYRIMRGGRGFTGVEFSRAGHPNPAGFLRSDLQRVAYVPDQDTLLRQTWRVLDRAQDSKPDEQVLVENISRFSMRFLNTANEWLESWPPPLGLSATTEGLPQAVEVELELDNFGVINWIFRLPQEFVAGTQAPSGSNAGAGEDEGEGAPAEDDDAADGEET
jgi:general secretion pathway protein J